MANRDAIFHTLNVNMKKAVDELVQMSSRYGPNSVEVKAAMQRRALTLKALFDFRASRQRVE